MKLYWRLEEPLEDSGKPRYQWSMREPMNHWDSLDSFGKPFGMNEMGRPQNLAVVVYSHKVDMDMAF